MKKQFIALYVVCLMLAIATVTVSGKNETFTATFGTSLSEAPN